jgi:aminoglycoside phosphotransferase (APT) family kinase protein
VIKAYPYHQTNRFKCFGSGARNEALLPTELSAFIPTLWSYSADAIGESVVLEERCGNHLLPNDLGPETARLAGATLGRIHSVTGAGFGSLDGKYRFGSVSETFTARWKLAMALLSSVDRSLAEKVDSWATPRVSRLKSPERPHLVHGDFGPANILWNSAQEVIAVLDWEHAHYGDPGEDWAKITLAARFPEPNGFGTDHRILGALAEGWKTTVHGVGNMPNGASREVYEAYFAASLGVFFGNPNDERLAWLAELANE